MDDLREVIARAICEADCGCVTENELARCEGLTDAALAAIKQAGFVVVPAEPTEAMVEAYYELCDLGGDLKEPEEGCKVQRAYRAMIEASNG